jgi:hypothetical protein
METNTSNDLTRLQQDIARLNFRLKANAAKNKKLSANAELLLRKACRSSEEH